MARIYALVSGEEVLYVGRTTRTLVEREWNHRAVGNSAGSKNIPIGINWEIKLLEECEENATARERHYIEILKPPYNKLIPGRTEAEYNHTDERKAYQRAYQHTEARKASQRAYRQTEAGKASYREAARRYRLKKKSEQGV
jgi:hypothetical protein